MSGLTHPIDAPMLVYMLKEHAGADVPEEVAASWDRETNIEVLNWSAAMGLANKYGYPDIPPIPEVVLPYMEVIEP